MAFRGGPKLSKDELRAQADAAMAKFKGGGGAVQQLPGVVATDFVCKECGHTQTIGVREGQTVRCQRCRMTLN